MFHADGWMDGWTDMTKLIVAFRSFANSRDIQLRVSALKKL